MDYRDLIDNYYKLQKRAAELRMLIRLGNHKDFSKPNSRGNSGACTPDDMEHRAVPITDSYQLESMERERVELLAERGRQLKDRSQMQQERQEAILKRICGTVPDRDSPLNHPTRGNCRVRDTIRLEPLRKSLSTSFRSDASCVDDCPRLVEPQNIQNPWAVVREENSPFRLEDLPPGLYAEVKAMQAHISEEADIAAWNTRAVRIPARAGHSRCSQSSIGTCTSMNSRTPVDSRTPDELRALSALRTPVPPPAVCKPSRLPRLVGLHRRVKAVEKACNVPVSRKDSKVSESVASKQCGVRARASERRGSGACREAGGSRATPDVAKSGQGREPEPHCKPASSKAGPKAARFRQGVVPGSHKKPAQERDAPRAVPVSQGPGDMAETLGLVKVLPLVRPELGLSQAFQLLEHEDWEKKIEGLSLVQSLAQNHTDVLLPKLHDVCLAVVEEVKNLRSMVSRIAMTTLAHMFTHLRRAMDPEAGAAARVLLHKAGESSLFIREDVDLALGAMVQSCSPRRVMLALLEGGLSHRNAAVRKTTALHLERFAQLLGASLLLSKKDLTERFLPAISRLALDAAQEVRFHARGCVKFLATHKDFMKMVEKFVPPKDRSSIKDIIMKGRYN